MSNENQTKDETITVKKLKEWINSIPEELDSRELVLDGHGIYTDGYNPVTFCDYEHIQVADNFPTDKKDKKTKLVVLLRIM